MKYASSLANTLTLFSLGFGALACSAGGGTAEPGDGDRLGGDGDLASSGSTGSGGGPPDGSGSTTGSGGLDGTGSESGSGGLAGTGSETGSGGLAGTGGGGAVEACPADAYFCTGFEDAGIPTGATYHPAYQAGMWTSFMNVQGTTVKEGTQALEVDGVGGYMWNLLSTPVPSSAFWARFYLRSSEDIGQSEHNSYVAAMTGDGEPNTGDNTEISEQYCQMVLNLHDKVATSIGGSEMCSTGVAPLPKDTWHCVEVHFDGPGGLVQVFANNQPVIDVTGWDVLDYKSFGFGYFGFHGPARTLWYDDVAVGPTRPGCP